MRLRDYLELKYCRQGGRSGSVSITKAEAKVVGVPYPLRSGWLEQFGGMEITEQMRDGLVEVLSAMSGRDAASGLDVFVIKTAAGTFLRKLR